MNILNLLNDTTSTPKISDDIMSTWRAMRAEAEEALEQAHQLRFSPVAMSDSPEEDERHIKEIAEAYERAARLHQASDNYIDEHVPSLSGI